MADEDWESELVSGPAYVSNFGGSEPEFKENTHSSFSTNRDFNKNFESTNQDFGSKKDDNFNQNYESSGRGFGWQRGRSDGGRGRNSNTFNRGFDSSDSQERPRFSGFGNDQNNDQSRPSRGGFNNDNFRSRGRGGSRGGRGSYHSGDTDDVNNQRNFARTGDNHFGNRGFGRSGDGDDSDDKRVSERTGFSTGFRGRRGFGRRGGNNDADGNRNFGGTDESDGFKGFGRRDESDGFKGFGRRANNDEADGGDVGEFRRAGGNTGFENRRDFSRRGGYRGKNEEVCFDSGKGQDDAKADTGPKVTYIPPPPPEAEEDIFRHYQTGINFDKYDNIMVNVTGSNRPPAILSFEEADLSESLTRNVYKSGYVKLTPIQKHSIPIIMAGRDLMACAQTGSGKTAAFLLPILAHMMKNGVASSHFQTLQEPEAIIVAPTRELINQIYLDARKFAHGTIVRPVVIYGGTQTSHSFRQICQGCNVLCATPGRLMDVINKERIGLSKVKYLVLDEADRMLDMGFLPDMKNLLASPGMPSKEERQTLMFSATFPTEIQDLAKDILKPDYLFVAVGEVGGACSDVEQQIIQVDEYGKRDKLLEILQSIGHERTMVFVKTKKKADFIASFLVQENIKSTSIHGDRLQPEREKALTDFRSGECPVIVATSVAARGLDIENVLHVINFDIPSDIDEYVHRIGRTGRCGNTGKAISFFNIRGEDEKLVCRGLVKVLTDAEQEVPLWLEEVAFGAHGMSSYSQTSRNFASVDNRKRGGYQQDGYSNSGFSQPAAEEEENWG